MLEAWLRISPLLSLWHEQHLLFHSLVRFTGRADVNHSRASQVAPGQALHGWRHGGCEHDGLKMFGKKQLTHSCDFQTVSYSQTYLSVFIFPWFKVHHHLIGVLRLLCVRLLIGHWDELQDLLDVGFEAHVDHTIGLVKDHICAATQDQVSVVQHVYQTTRGGYHNL